MKGALLPECEFTLLDTRFHKSWPEEWSALKTKVCISLRGYGSVEYENYLWTVAIHDFAFS